MLKLCFQRYNNNSNDDDDDFAFSAMIIIVMMMMMMMITRTLFANSGGRGLDNYKMYQSLRGYILIGCVNILLITRLCKGQFRNFQCLFRKSVS